MGSGDAALILDPGYSISGNVGGGGANSTLELAEGSTRGVLNALGTKFTDFGALKVDTDAVWTVDALASALTGVDITGAGGSDILAITSSGSANLSQVTDFPTIDLAAGGNTVTPSDTTLRGGAVTIQHGASGSNSVNASGDTAASTGKTLTYFAGAGSDTFKGGFENDIAYLGSGAGSYTAGSGKDQFVFTADNLPTQTLDDFAVTRDIFVFYGTHEANGFDLGATDNAENPSAATAIAASIFTANATGAFDSTNQRFAYDTMTGRLFYSADGSGGLSREIASLTGAPALAASNLFFEH
jgi:hypothetical protein